MKKTPIVIILILLVIIAVLLFIKPFTSHEKTNIADNRPGKQELGNTSTTSTPNATNKAIPNNSFLDSSEFKTIINNSIVICLTRLVQ